MPADLELNYSSSNNVSLLAILTVPTSDLSALPSGKVSENFHLPKPFETVFGHFTNNGKSISFDTTTPRPVKLIYSLRTRGKTTDYDVDISAPTDEMRFGKDWWPQYVGEIQENGSVILELEIIPKMTTIHDTKVPSIRNELFANVFDEESFADFKLICDGKTIKVAKAIIGSQSEFFQAIFESDIEDSNSGELEITNMAHETLRLLIKFMYSGKVDGDINLDTLIAAEYLGIKNFKEHYEEFASKKLNVDTINEVLLIAQKYEMPNLEKKCFKFLEANDAWATGYKNILTNEELTVKRPVTVKLEK